MKEPSEMTFAEADKEMNRLDIKLDGPGLSEQELERREKVAERWANLFCEKEIGI